MSSELADPCTILNLIIHVGSTVHIPFDLMQLINLDEKCATAITTLVATILHSQKPNLLYSQTHP